MFVRQGLPEGRVCCPAPGHAQGQLQRHAPGPVLPGVGEPQLQVPTWFFSVTIVVGWAVALVISLYLFSASAATASSNCLQFLPSVGELAHCAAAAWHRSPALVTPFQALLQRHIAAQRTRRPCLLASSPSPLSALSCRRCASSRPTSSRPAAAWMLWSATPPSTCPLPRSPASPPTASKCAFCTMCSAL